MLLRLLNNSLLSSRMANIKTLISQFKTLYFYSLFRTAQDLSVMIVNKKMISVRQSQIITVLVFQFIYKRQILIQETELVLWNNLISALIPILILYSLRQFLEAYHVMISLKLLENYKDSKILHCQTQLKKYHLQDIAGLHSKTMNV